MEKFAKLQELLRSYGKATIAYSGGVDSSFLLRVALDTLGKENVLAITILSSVTPREELAETEKFLAAMDVNHIFIKKNVLEIPGFKENPSDRCYICKHKVFEEILERAKEKGIAVVVDGTNADDEGDYRPGLKALQELKVLSPLKLSGLGKSEIRELSKELKLNTWNKPSLACLASRVPYYEEITEEKLSMVDKTEAYLRSLGFTQLRVRCHGKLARIELVPEDIKRIFTEDLNKAIDSKLKEIGFQYVSMDLIGYRTGSLNEVLGKLHRD
ncbi:MAG TPA: ATP-dependent sacrificial sulfur transferase LarE [Clostridia bacterium]|nr:ATP-dependent sacrificial sulfur transferase LarE [Clostridia bacterium]